MERALKTSLIFITLFFVLFLAAPAAHAELTDQKKCEDWKTYFWSVPAVKCVFQKVTDALPELDLRRTIMGTLETIMVEAVPFAVTHRSMAELQGCVVWMAQEEYLGCTIDDSVAIEPPPGGCEDLNWSYGNEERFAYNGRVGGSLLSLAFASNDMAEHEKIPMNLAFYANDIAKRTPILNNTAFASEPNFENAPVLAFVLDVWRVVRNIAYGILAVIMLVAGIMIMLRKKISPQAVVTIQNALPKIALAVVLITFSYPIGALAAGIAWPLAKLPYYIFQDINASAGLSALNIGPGLGMIGIVMSALSILGAGGIVMLGLMLLFLVYVLLWFYAGIKALFIYFKIVASIVSAPLEFAAGAIPGAESSIVNWFKRIGAYIASIPAIFFLMFFSIHVMLRALKYNSCATWGLIGFNDIGGVGSSTLIFMVTPLLMIFLAWMAVKVPDKVEGLILGTKRR